MIDSLDNQSVIFLSVLSSMFYLSLSLCLYLSRSVFLSSSQTLFLKVILGGGRQEFLPTSVEDPEYYDVTGRREDGNNLIGQWQGEKTVSSSHYVWNKEDFDNVDATTTDYLLGVWLF